MFHATLQHIKTDNVFDEDLVTKLLFPLPGGFGCCPFKSDCSVVVDALYIVAPVIFIYSLWGGGG